MENFMQHVKFMNHLQHCEIRTDTDSVKLLLLRPKDINHRGEQRTTTQKIPDIHLRLSLTYEDTRCVCVCRKYRESLTGTEQQRPRNNLRRARPAGAA